MEKNYQILSEVFNISNDFKMREIAMKGGLLQRIFERLGNISGEKARKWQQEEEIKVE